MRKTQVRQKWDLEQFIGQVVSMFFFTRSSTLTLSFLASSPPSDCLLGPTHSMLLFSLTSMLVRQTVHTLQSTRAASPAFLKQANEYDVSSNVCILAISSPFCVTALSRLSVARCRINVRFLVHHLACIGRPMIDFHPTVLTRTMEMSVLSIVVAHPSSTLVLIFKTDVALFQPGSLQITIHHDAHHPNSIPILHIIHPTNVQRTL